MDVVAWSAHPPPGYCALEYIENVEDDFELKRGISRAEDFPADASFSMRKGAPKAKKLGDQISNMDRLTVVSTPLKEFLERKRLPDVEYLRVSIIDHKGRVASDAYYVVNPLRVIDCIDQQASDLSWNEIDTELVSGCFELGLKEDALDPKYPLFRPRYMPTVVLLEQSVAEEMEAEGFVGMYFFDIDEFTL